MENFKTPMRPTVGQKIAITGRGFFIVRKVHPFGTADVECPKTGRFFRVTGLGWL